MLTDLYMWLFQALPPLLLLLSVIDAIRYIAARRKNRRVPRSVSTRRLQTLRTRAIDLGLIGIVLLLLEVSFIAVSMMAVTSM